GAGGAARRVRRGDGHVPAAGRGRRPADHAARRVQGEASPQAGGAPRGGGGGAGGGQGEGHGRAHGRGLGSRGGPPDRPGAPRGPAAGPAGGEGGETGRRTQTGRPGPAGTGGADRRATAAVAAGGHVEEAGGVGVRVGGREVRRPRRTGERVDRRDDRSGD